MTERNLQENLSPMSTVISCGAELFKILIHFIASLKGAQLFCLFKQVKNNYWLNFIWNTCEKMFFLQDFDCDSVSCQRTEKYCKSAQLIVVKMEKKISFDFCHEIKYKALYTICITCAHRHNLIWSLEKINFHISCHYLLS
mgnify:CR=1 FL=1